MATALGRFRPIVIALSVILTLMIGWLVLNVLARSMVGTRLERLAESRGLDASWHTLRVRFPTELSVEGLAFSPPEGAPFFQADTLDLEASLISVLTLRPRPKRIRLTGARVRLGVRGVADPDTLAPDERARAPEPIDRIRQRVRAAIDLLLAPVRDVDLITIRDVTISPGRGDDAVLRGILIDRFDHVQHDDGIEVDGAGSLLLAREVAWGFALDYGRNDSLTGRAHFDIPPESGRAAQALDVTLAARLIQDRSRGVVTLADSAVVGFGSLSLAIAAEAWRAEPRVAFSLATSQVTRRRIVESVPGAVLGPLSELYVTGAFDYFGRLAIDFSNPDSVQVEARVTPRAMAIDSTRSGIGFELDRPFQATVLLPGADPAARLLHTANPFYRPLDRIDTVLVNAVVTNEDGGFFRHGGFNVGAVKQSIAENLRAGGYRRGAGTITMQLARNLYTGHDRTLSRKGQEVVLAWVLEHLSGLSKQRLLEVYLNVIEWGPGVHGAGEAARYYFDRDPADLSVDEALFLSTVVPSPRKWARRFDDQRQLRDYVRAQMHFIGRAMIRKGWLDPELLPPADSLAVELRGAALAALMPPDSTLEQAVRNLDGTRAPWPERLGGETGGGRDTVETQDPR